MCPSDHNHAGSMLFVIKLWSADAGHMGLLSLRLIV